MFSIIVAVDLNNGIGLNNKLLCHLPNDLKRFKEITTGKSIIMGLKTYESLPKKPLPNRRNIVLSDIPLKEDGIFVANSIANAFSLCYGSEESFIIGGEMVYRQTLPLVNKLYLTRIYHEFECDRWFPDIDPYDWQLQSSERHLSDEKHLYEYSFETYTRI